MMPFRLSYLVTGLYLLTNVIQAKSHLGHTIITTSVILPPQGNEYRYTQGKAVYYQLDLSSPGNLIIHNWKTDYSAGPGYTTLYVLKKAQEGEAGDWSEGELSFKWVATFEEHEFFESKL